MIGIFKPKTGIREYLQKINAKIISSILQKYKCNNKEVWFFIEPDTVKVDLHIDKEGNVTTQNRAAATLHLCCCYIIPSDQDQN